MDNTLKTIGAVLMGGILVLLGNTAGCMMSLDKPRNQPVKAEISHSEEMNAPAEHKARSKW